MCYVFDKYFPHLINTVFEFMQLTLWLNGFGIVFNLIMPFWEVSRNFT